MVKYIKTMAQVEREYFLKVLKWFNGNRTHTADALGVSLRTVRNKITLYRREGHL